MFMFLSLKDSAGLTNADLAGRTVSLHISQAACTACTQGFLNGNQAAGVLQQFSLRYPTLNIRVTSSARNVSNANLTPADVIIIRNGRVVNDGG